MQTNQVWSGGSQRAYTQKEQIMFLDCRDYIKNANENTPIEFTVFLSRSDELPCLNISPYDEVTQVKLKGINFPKIAYESYFILDIPEFGGRLDSSDQSGSHDSFAVVYYKANLLKGEIDPMQGTDFDNKIKTFTPPIKNFNRFTVRFKKYGGDVLKFQDIIKAGESINDAMNNVSLLLEFTIKA